MGRDNISGIIDKNVLKTIFLTPGRIIQWFMYMFVANLRYGGVRQQTRLARSPLMTYIYSIIFWIIFFFYISSITGTNKQYLKYFINPFLWSPSCYVVSKFTDENLSFKNCYTMFNKAFEVDNKVFKKKNHKNIDPIDKKTHGTPKGTMENILETLND